MNTSYKQLPVFRKAEDIIDITRALIEIINAEKDECDLRESMLSNAYLLGAKIAGAEGGNLYSLRMENATLVKMAACNLKADATLCAMEELTDENYISVLIDEIEIFRITFRDWVDSFDPKNDIEDGWGLF